MTIEQAHESISFVGDSCFAGDGEHDIRHCVAEVVSRLPDDVSEWLLYQTRHVFVNMVGTRGEYAPMLFPPPPYGELDGGLLKVRFILLSECLQREPRHEALHTIAHEIAHSYRNDDSSNADAEEATDRLAAEWGFPTPPDRAEVIAGMRRIDASPASRPAT